jgi:hypothetical protein
MGILIKKWDFSPKIPPVLSVDSEADLDHHSGWNKADFPFEQKRLQAWPEQVQQASEARECGPIAGCRLN